MKKGAATVVFGQELPRGPADGVLIAPAALASAARERGWEFVALEPLCGTENVYDASALLEEFSGLSYPDGRPIAASVIYEGFELWWVHYNALLSNFCLPYTEYRGLLEHLCTYEKVRLHEPPYPSLFSYYLEAHRTPFVLGVPSSFGFGTAIQVLCTLASLPVLALRRAPVMVFVGDKIQAGTDYDARMAGIYAHLRARDVRFMECIRSLEPWRTVLRNALVRRRAALYSEAVLSFARFISFFSGRPFRKAVRGSLRGVSGPDAWKVRAAAHFLLGADEDIWAVRSTRALFGCIGVRVGVFTAILERNAHAALACKLSGIPTIGILHGVASRYSTPYDFMPGFKGKRVLSTDLYGVWSEWWKEYFINESDAYAPGQLVVSGPMRPLRAAPAHEARTGPLEVLFMAEQRALPDEVLPYLRALLAEPDLRVTIKFRPFRDGFEEWLRTHEPALLADVPAVRGSMHDALRAKDVVVGSHSTGVLEGLLQGVVPIFVYTNKWGDYYNLRTDPEREVLFAQHPEELIARVRSARTVPAALLEKLRTQYFGEWGKDGSAWVVAEVMKVLSPN